MACQKCLWPGVYRLGILLARCQHLPEDLNAGGAVIDGRKSLGIKAIIAEGGGDFGQTDGRNLIDFVLPTGGDGIDGPLL